MKSFLFVLRHAPHGTAYGKEGLDAILMASAFVPTSLLLLGDGIFQVKAEQRTEELGVRNYAATFGALDHYDVREIFVSARDLAERGLREEQLSIPVTLLQDDEIRELLRSKEMILTF